MMEMKMYQVLLVAFALLLTTSLAKFPCMQPLEMRHNNEIILQAKVCEQSIDQSMLQVEPEIFYRDNLSMNLHYTLFFMENNMNASSYTIHWCITNIVPVNGSLTSNKTVILNYVPPSNFNSSIYTIQIFKHPSNFNIHSLSNIEMKEFMPDSWAAPFYGNVSTELVLSINVSGRNMSAEYQPPKQTQLPPHQTHPSYQPSPPVVVTSAPTTTPQQVTPRPHYSVQPSVSIVTYRPGHVYNITNSTNTTTSKTPTISPDHKKNSASNNVFSHLAIVIPLISVAVRVIF